MEVLDLQAYRKMDVTRKHQLYLGTERYSHVAPNWFEPCQCCCRVCYPGEYLGRGTLVSYN